MVTGEIDETRVTSVLLPSIFLGVTAFLLHLVISRLVGVQREQIAVLKAFGYGHGAVAAHYAGMALAPLVAGIILGAASGVWFAHRLAGVYARFFRFPDAGYDQDWGVVATAALVTVVVAMAGALVAVGRAFRLAPAEAMRPEAPPRFGAGPLERWGVTGRLPPAARLVLRVLEHRPGRAALATLGVALSGALVVAGLYVFDAVGHIERVQFQDVQREDVTVSFQEPRPPTAARELEHLPGVLAVEPFRLVPVRLRSAHRSRRAALVGLEAGARLRRVVDAARVPHGVRRDGLLLGRSLAERLAVGAGDVVRVDVLEGRRPTRILRVAEVVDDLLGATAYLELEAVHRVTGDGRAISGAFLRADPDGVARLYRALKRLPGVSDVAVRSATVEGFRRTIAESFRISLLVTVLFACALTAGVVYNSARIALSERGRELASLRVLGFTRAEVSRLLLAEQAVLTAFALPLAAALGLLLCWLISERFESDLFRIPLVTVPRTYLSAAAVVLAAATVSGLLVRRRIARLDLVAVLKTRE
jgi:putative ABC transport system permease protein